ncbi:MAG: UDP-2,3-diacylglucosamine diphosphatase [Pseudomonadales bacterium]|nr:UDP-2,3-diacylglucosamine diphosphatase [Pseudomonadales bacterium]
MNKLFISDLHLDESRPDLTQALATFLDQKAPQANELYILGDFFEVWLGDDYISKYNEKIIQLLARLEIPIFMMHGNRDFLLGEAICNKIGATLLVDPCVIDIDGTQVLLMHGDSLCTRDTEYMQARKILRDKNFQADFLSKSVAERQAFADAAREQSKAHTGKLATDADPLSNNSQGNSILDVTASEVEKIMHQYAVQTLIHGHTHRPMVHQLTVQGQPAQRFVLGDWDKTGWYLDNFAGELRLQSFDI